MLKKCIFHFHAHLLLLIKGLKKLTRDSRIYNQIVLWHNGVLLLLQRRGPDKVLELPMPQVPNSSHHRANGSFFCFFFLQFGSQKSQRFKFNQIMAFSRRYSVGYVGMQLPNEVGTKHNFWPDLPKEFWTPFVVLGRRAQ